MNKRESFFDNYMDDLNTEFSGGYLSLSTPVGPAPGPVSNPSSVPANMNIPTSPYFKAKPMPLVTPPQQSDGGCLYVLSLFIKFCTMLVRIVFVTVNNLYCIPTYTIWFFTFYPLKFFNAPLFWYIEGRFFHWLLSMVSLWSYTAGYHIFESGHKIEEIVEQETLAMVNHQSTSDVPLLMAAFNTRSGLLPNLNWIMDRVFKFTNFGIVSMLHGDFFVGSGKDKRERTIRELGDYLYDVYVPRARKWIVIFPEGGFLHKRRTVSQRYARKNNLPLLEHVTLPRMGAVQAIMDGIGPTSKQRYEESLKMAGNSNADYQLTTLKYVLDITIAYPAGKPLDIIDIITGYVNPCKVHVHYRLFPIDKVPTSEDGFQDWLFKRYEEKELMLRTYYETGVWKITHEHDVPLAPGGDDEDDLNEPFRIRPKKVEQDMLQMFILHAFFLFSTFFHITVGAFIYYYVTGFF